MKTSIMANRMESPTTCTFLRSNNCSKQCLMWRFSQWLWSSWFIGSTEERPAVAELPSCQKNTSSSWPSEGNPDVGQREQPTEDLERSTYPCKACQAWGVACDLQKPRCAHCLDEQLLCFYVAPLPPLRATRRSKKSRPTLSQPLLPPREIDTSG
ncbi:hypothetical protein BDV29DRAFT_45114 [Aspergillus leporis]|uniref:Zn(2)-C6 fungal-type domain-containing protein n=1 Tax=Aspergillus leporis TaxID=41062 RepID=A0A5N5WNC8_9EURO|nr:hypothetical protein BDV29DRAFT_45114 [Aspergillus leporis]